jgi:hypothetical protein
MGLLGRHLGVSEYNKYGVNVHKLFTTTLAKGVTATSAKASRSRRQRLPAQTRTYLLLIPTTPINTIINFALVSLMPVLI